MKRMLEHPPLYAVVTTLAQAVMSQPLFPIGRSSSRSCADALAQKRPADRDQPRTGLILPPAFSGSDSTAGDTTHVGRCHYLCAPDRQALITIVSAHIRLNRSSPLFYSAPTRRGSDVGGGNERAATALSGTAGRAGGSGGCLASRSCERGVRAATVTFLYSHCAGCGMALGSSENALLRELEIGELSAWGPCAVEFDYPMCGDCYSRLVRSRMDVLVYDGSVLHNMSALNRPKGGTTWPFGAVHKPPRAWSPTLN